MTDTPLWTSDDIAAATGAVVTVPFAVTGVSFDSRRVVPGDLFLALAGTEADGHRFVAQALVAGATGAVVARPPEGVSDDAPLALVGDTACALGALACRARERMTGKVIGVTGSVGKTGTKEALKAVFTANGPTHASAASFNNHVGVPLSLARMPEGKAFGIFELGMNHAGELGLLSRMVRPHIAIVTTIEPAHNAFFPSIEAIADAKAEIFEGVEPGGTAVLNCDNAFFDHLADAARARGIDVVSFGASAGSDVRLRDVVLKADLTVVDAEVMGTRVAYKIGAPGRHWAVNSLAVMAAVWLAGADLYRAAGALSAFEPPAGRGKRLRVSLPKGGSFTLVDESYNASPAAMRAAFATLRLTVPSARGRRIAVLGDMLELGGEADALHAGLAPDLVAAGVDLVLTCGIHMQALTTALPGAIRGIHTPDSRALAPIIAEIVCQEDVVLVKGSLGSYMSTVISQLLELDSTEK